jgi:hypothetical protein
VRLLDWILFTGENRTKGTEDTSKFPNYHSADSWMDICIDSALTFDYDSP